MKRIKLTQGKYALVDDADYEYLSQWNWMCSKNKTRKGYACRTKRVEGKKIGVIMHRLIMDAPKGMVTDHINHNTLDNRRENLRICTQSENNRNIKSLVNSTSKYLGVHWSYLLKRWVASMNTSGKHKYLGIFKTELEAAIIYNIAARKYHGEFANPNKFQ